jgi:hypothetical protein
MMDFNAIQFIKYNRLELKCITAWSNESTKFIYEVRYIQSSVLFGNAVVAALMSGRKYGVIPQNGDCSRESNVRTSIFETKSIIKKQRRYRTEHGKALLEAESSSGP